MDSSKSLIDRANFVLALLKETREAAAKGEWRLSERPHKASLRCKGDVLIESPDWEIAVACADCGEVPDGDQSETQANARAIVLRHNGWQADEDLVRGLLRLGCEASANGARDCSSGDHLMCWWCASLDRWTSFWEKELGVGR